MNPNDSLGPLIVFNLDDTRMDSADSFSASIEAPLDT